MNIVILGAGYVGVRLALDLEELVRSKHPRANIILVDRHPYHQIVQVLHQTAADAIGREDSVVDLEPLFRQRNVQLQQSEVSRIEPLQRKVLLGDGGSIEYDKLVIALGNMPNYWGIPGAAEHTMPLRFYDDALHLRDHVIARVSETAGVSDATRKRILMTFAIVGGGYTGCQLAGELADWLPRLADEKGVPRREVRIALLDRNDVLLRQFGKWASTEAERVLDRRGVSVYLNTSVERVEPQALYLNGNRVLRAGTLVWAAGFKAPPLLADSGLPTDRFGRVEVDCYLRVKDQAHIFAAGDCAAIPGPEGKQVPATASYAMRQGEHLADTLLAEIEGRAPRSYEPLQLGELVSLGPGEAIGNPLGLPVFGGPAMLLKKGVEAWYRSTLQ
jgi:NADH:ubiquinone reductase (H+-translocating)